MDKQELIDKVVEELKGKLPPEPSPGGRLSNVDGQYYIYKGDIIEKTSDISNRHICTESEFMLRAKEKGFINGFKWGVEYPTNGKKPDLPDDTLVQVYTPECEWSWTIELTYGAWIHVTKFRIVDQRYKPKEPESHGKPSVDGAKSKPDNSWYERGEWPPVGVECEINYSKNAWFSCVYRGKTRRGMHIVEWLGGGVDSFDSLSKFRPIKSEREKFVDAALAAADKFEPECDVTFAQALYDVGFKAPDEKSSS